MSECRFMDVKLDDMNLDMAVAFIGSSLEKKGYICMNDVRNIIWATRDTGLKEAINASMLSLPDGMPLVWYCRLAGCKDIERITGFRILSRLMETPNHLSHFLLGDTQERIQAVMNKARKANPDITLEGYSPPFKKSFTKRDDEVTLEKIHQANPDLIWVSLGGGKQEKWMYKNFQHLQRGIMISVGAAFRFYIGELTMPPASIQALGLQWIWRITQDWSNAPYKGRSKIKSLTDRFVFFRYFPHELYQVRRNKFKARARQQT